VLHRTHDALMAFRPAQDVELIIGPAVGWNGQSLQVPPAQEPVCPEPVGPRVERTSQPAAQPVADPVYERARPMAQPNPPAQAPSTPDPEPDSFNNFSHDSPEGLTPSWAVLPLMQVPEPVEEEPAYPDLLVRSPGESEATPMEYLLPAVDEMVSVPFWAAQTEWTAADVFPIAIYPAGPLMPASQLKPAGEFQAALKMASQAKTLSAETLDLDALAVALEAEALSLEPMALKPVANAPRALKSAEGAFRLRGTRQVGWGRARSRH